MPSDDETRYSDSEIALIIQSALDLERQKTNSGKAGLSLSEIEDIARETGISPENIRQAVEEIARLRKGRPARFWLGAETSFDDIEMVPIALDQLELERLEKSLPALTSGSESKVADDGSIFWKRGILKSLLDGFPLKLKVSPSQDETRIETHINLASIAAAIFPVFGGIGVVTGLKLSLFSILMIGMGKIGWPLSILFLSLGGLLGLGGFWLLARIAFRSFVKRSRAKVTELVAKIKSTIQSIHKGPIV